jgi:hypothetical protein
MASVLNTTLLRKDIKSTIDECNKNYDNGYSKIIIYDSILKNAQKIKEKSIGIYSEKGYVKLYKVVKQEYTHLYDIDNECGHFMMKYDEDNPDPNYKIEDKNHLIYVILECQMGTCDHCGGVNEYEDIYPVLDAIVAKAYISENLEEIEEYYNSRILTEW